MEKTVVVNVRYSDYDVYIGRANRFKGFKHNIFANPYKMGKGITREQVIKKYRALFYERLKNPRFKAEVEKLRGKRLGCWCVPKPCHGDVIVEYLENGEGE